MANASPDPIRIGVVAGEPIRLAGLATVFDLPAQAGQPRLMPVVGSMAELLGDPGLEYLVVDLQASSGGLETLESIRQIRPDIRQIVIGPERDDELVLSSIVAGARAYLDLTAGPDVVRQAVEVVTSGSIWAPRRLLSKLIDRLLKVPETTSMAANVQLTSREQQVLELILMARSNREIAKQLGIEERTVKAYVGRLMRKTGADNRIKLSMSPLGRSLREGAKRDSDAPPKDITQ
ncbi:MAG TPA: response regulator transcription factor [Terracidiphilus sp.]|nr:response regulator transcription factor [Terracidiphilus sp.]